MKVLCRECEGNKVVNVPRMAVKDGKTGTVYVTEECKACEGKGFVNA